MAFLLSVFPTAKKKKKVRKNGITLTSFWMRRSELCNETQEEASASASFQNKTKPHPLLGEGTASQNPNLSSDWLFASCTTNSCSMQVPQQVSRSPTSFMTRWPLCYFCIQHSSIDGYLSGSKIMWGTFSCVENTIYCGYENSNLD